MSIRRCAVEGCDGLFHCKGYCQRHYQQAKIGKDPHAPPPGKRFCSVKECDDAYYAKGFCEKHYARVRKGQNPSRKTMYEKHGLQRFWEKVDKTGDCWIWTGGNNAQGYGHWHDGTRHVGVHRYSYELTNGPIPKGFWVCHRCDNPACLKPAHLFLGKPKDNARDMVKKGRSLKGRRNPYSKLTPEQVRWIRSNPENLTQKEMAARLEVVRTCINKVVRRETWRHID